VSTSLKRLIAALVFVLPVGALVATPAMAAKRQKAKTSQTAHKVSTHKAPHKIKKAA
jgi:hypothetical protein